jgi:hypothetical protein
VAGQRHPFIVAGWRETISRGEWRLTPTRWKFNALITREEMIGQHRFDRGRGEEATALRVPLRRWAARDAQRRQRDMSDDTDGRERAV